MASNAVDQLRERTGARSDAALARLLGRSTSCVANWRRRNRVTLGSIDVPARGEPLTVDDLRTAITLLSPEDRRLLTLELMAGTLGR